MKKLPLGIQNFREIIREDYIYIDKTKYVYDLLNSVKSYFLSRPRRFGKSLLLDTIGEVFSGDRELFKGLWIYDSDYAFPKHPVLRLDMSNIANKTPEILERELTDEMLKHIGSEGFKINSDIPSNLFKNLIESLYKKYGQGVVVLIDEYDKPILDHLLDIDTAEANRMVVKSFYGILKSMDPFLRLTFVTGVTKFTKTSIFSEMNNLLDITLTREYANICGIPVDELDEFFHEHIEHLAGMEDFREIDDLRGEILDWYDGYSWDGKTRVLNPFGLLSFFMQKRFESFWYASGSPKFLVDLLKTKPASFLLLHDLMLRESALDSFDIRRIGAPSLLFQTGYLTVKEIMPGTGSRPYRLGIPNREVREAFNINIIAEFTESGGDATESAYLGLKEALQASDLGRVRDILKSLFASIPYQLHVDAEAYYHSIFYAIMNLLGFDIAAEVSVSGGRIDAALEMGDKVYVMEFKYRRCPPEASPEEKRALFDKALEEGLKQVAENGYADKYAGSGKDIVQAVFAFLGRDDIEMRIAAGQGL